MKLCLDCRRPIVSQCLGYCTDCKPHHECFICREIYPLPLGLSRRCPDCLQVSHHLADLHRHEGHFPTSPERTARIQLYTERAEQHIALFEDVPPCLQQHA